MADNSRRDSAMKKEEEADQTTKAESGQVDAAAAADVVDDDGTENANGRKRRLEEAEANAAGGKDPQEGAGETREGASSRAIAVASRAADSAAHDSLAATTDEDDDDDFLPKPPPGFKPDESVIVKDEAEMAKLKAAEGDEVDEGKRSEKDEEAASSASILNSRKRQRKIRRDNESGAEEDEDAEKSASSKERAVKKRKSERKETKEEEEKKRRVAIDSDEDLFDATDDCPVKKEVKEEDKCRVCHTRAIVGKTFGISACRSCNDFFRENSKLRGAPSKCRQHPTPFICEVTTTGSRCRDCRLKQCCDAGMKSKVAPFVTFAQMIKDPRSPTINMGSLQQAQHQQQAQQLPLPTADFSILASLLSLLHQQQAAMQQMDRRTAVEMADRNMVNGTSPGASTNGFLSANGMPMHEESAPEISIVHPTANPEAPLASLAPPPAPPQPFIPFSGDYIAKVLAEMRATWGVPKESVAPSSSASMLAGSSGHSSAIGGPSAPSATQDDRRSRMEADFSSAPGASGSADSSAPVLAHEGDASAGSDSGSDIEVE